MITVTLHEAKAKLNQLVEAARLGEQVVLLKGSEVVATIRPLGPEDLEIAPQLMDDQAKQFWDEVGRADTLAFAGAKQAVEFLKKKNKSSP